MAAGDFDDREFQIPRHSKKDLGMQAVSLLGTRPNSAAENLFFISSGVHAHEPKKGPNLVNLPCILLGLHEKERQEVNNNAEETPVLQEPKANSAVETPILQETKINSAAETQGLQEPSATSGNQLCCLFRSKFHGSWNMVTRKGPGSGHPSNSCVSATAMGTYKICELFSVPRLSALPEVQREGRISFTEPPNFDKETGWDFFDASDRAQFWACLREQKPDLVLMSPECRPFSILMSSNWDRMSEGEALRIKTQGMAMLQFCIQVAAYQLEHGRQFLLEQPGSASSWATHAMKWLEEQLGVFMVQFDQCAAGLSLKPDTLSRKTTSCISNHLGLISSLSELRCSRDHEHLQLQGGLPSKAQAYPPGLLKTMLKGIISDLDSRQLSFPEYDDDEQVLGGDEDPAEDQASSGMRAPQTPSPVVLNPVKVSEKQKDLVYKLHVNLGHLPVNQMLSMLKAAGAQDSVRRFVKEEFKCPQCSKQQKPIPHKKATFPKTFSFNQIVGIDYFYVNFLNKTHAFINVVCQGTNLQQVALLPNYTGGPPNARDTWYLFSKLWIGPYGLPQVVLCDQGSEFKGFFERSLEQVGVLQSVADSATPWQNGRVERHGSWLKLRLEEEVQSGQAIIQSSQELETLAVLVAAHKNRWFHRGGYSPYQLVFGVNPRIPLELLSDDHMLLPGLADASAEPFESDTPASEFSRAHQIRQRARELCIASNLKDKVRLGISHQRHQQRQWSPGQWVFVWRKFPGTGNGHLTRSRWVGPGLVIMQSGHSVWISMRSRIWKCSSDQLRSASSAESIGAELMGSSELEDILTQTRAKRAGAVDVESEGSPPSNAWDQITAPHHQEVPALPEPPLVRPEEVSPPLETIPEGHAPMQSLIRDILPEVPFPPLEERHDPPRQVSIQTAEEPQVEPTPSVNTESSQESKRPRTEAPMTPGYVRRRVAQTESEKLEREALRELKRLEREERMNRRGAIRPSSQARSSQDAAPAVEVEPSLDADEELSSFFEVRPSPENEVLLAASAKAKNAEFNMKHATPEEIAGFKLSDSEEWSSILNLGAAKILSVEESKKVKRECPERVITSRMIRRKKPLPGIGNFKFKSRWCLHGHQDPDSGSFEIFSPMPSTESITLFFQLSLNLGLEVGFLDIKNAFCQGQKLDRPRGKLYAVPCEGLGISKDQLIEIVAPIYGLDDSPLRWHRTLLDFFSTLGFSRSLLEPCWLVKRVSGVIVCQILIEVDDLNIACSQKYLPTLKKALTDSFVFGKWESHEADFAGRHVKVTENRVLIHQEKYIIEKLHPVHLRRGRFSDKLAPLTEAEFEEFRSALYKVNWVAHQTRPEASGVVSILASRLKHPTVHDVSCLNKLISHLRSTASQPLVLHRFDTSRMTLIAASDAGGVDGKPPSGNISEDTVQGAWVVLAADRVPSACQKTKVSILSWRSAKLKRRVTSTLASEALSFSQALGELEWIQILIRDILHGDVNTVDWTRSLMPFVGVLKEDSELRAAMYKGPILEQCTVTDAKSLFDSLKKENPSSRQDRRTSIELAIIIQSMRRSNSILRWSPHPRMIADVLTKDDISKSNGALEELFRTGTLALWDEEDELARRKSNPSSKGRSKKASEAFRSAGETLLAECQINRSLGELSTLFTSLHFSEV